MTEKTEVQDKLRVVPDCAFGVFTWQHKWEVLLTKSEEGTIAAMFGHEDIISDPQPTLKEAMAELRLRYNAVARRLGWELVPENFKTGDVK